MTADPARSRRVRAFVFLAVMLLAVGGSVAYVARAYGDRVRASSGPDRADTAADLAAVTARPHVVFRSTAPGPAEGHVAAVPVDAAGGPRAVTPAVCDRVYATRAHAVCLAAEATLNARTYRVRVLDPGWTSGHDLFRTPGLSSRTRLSPSGALVATTAFVYGDSYNSPGKFSTRTTITPVGDTRAGTDLENYTLTIDGRVTRNPDRNFWGVTFADDETFYATAATGRHTYLVRGSVRARTLTALRRDVECPSLSPDGTRIAFKKHGTLADGEWRLAVYDLRTTRETLTAETRSVDDQAEWLDDTHLLYGLRTGPVKSSTTDIWTVDASGGGTPRIFIPQGWSPSVIR
ncbi:TolB-like translocation protein; signal peptide [Actinoplanes sp. NBRC 14428]|nr:TolB-like translocation protein; signal peptide [Actinoplanes sp. NBRC 14428]